MIGSRSFAGSGGHALDAPVAALAGLSVAFLAFAAPADLLGDMVAASGLPSLVPAAAPPLGFSARIGLAAAGAVGAFALAFLLLRWLGQVGTRPVGEATEADGAEPLRVRRRDFHPDAAPRPPLFAVAELGEPAPQAQPAPFAAAEVGEPEPATEPEYLLEREAEARPEPVPEPDRREAAGDHAWLPEPDRAEPAPPPLIGTSIAELMERLERGLARRQSGPPAAAPSNGATPRPEAAIVPDAGDDRLQSAIESLERLAARQH